MEHLRGKFIVIEGLDGAGGSTQANRLVSHLMKQGLVVKKVSYPDYSSPLGQMILKMLRDKDFRSEESANLTPTMQFLLYAADMVKDIGQIAGWLDEGSVVVADRYFTSTLAYQGAMGFPLKKGVEFGEMFSILKPDYIIYLRISPETSWKRKKQEGSLDWFEEDKAFLGKVEKSYNHLAGNNVLGGWKIVDAEKQISEVFGQILEALEQRQAAGQ